MKSIQLELSTDVKIHEIYKRIRNYLAGRVIGITRDKSLLHEVVKCLFCCANIHAGKEANFENDAEATTKLYRKKFAELKKLLPYIFNEDEEILLDPQSLLYVHNELSQIDFLNPQKDPLGELYQAFIGSDMRMAEGQFFTPHEAVSWLVEAIEPKEGETIIDPACGPGGFLSYSARYLLNQGVSREKINDCLFGIEKDEYLSNLANAHLALATFKKPNVICADSIEWKKKEGKSVPFKEKDGFDIVLANPPFGAKIQAGDEDTRKKFDLAYKWSLNKKTGRWEKTDTLQKNTSPQILFLELCLKLLKPGGRMGIVVPESMVSNSSTAYVVQYLTDKANLITVCGMPESLFKTSGKGGTHTKTCLLIAQKKPCENTQSIFMAEAKWCGHDSRGNRIPKNDLPIALKNLKDQKVDEGGLGYYIQHSEIIDNILAPRYYNPAPTSEINAINHSHDIVKIKDLVEEGVLSFSTGDEVGKLAYGTGNIPFVRTSDISNWEIKLDPKHGLSEEIYNAYARKQDVREGDILMVRDGTYLIGSCAYVSKYDEKIIYQSHIYKIRVNRKDIISPFLLLALLSCEPVIEQIKSKRFTQDIIDTLGKRVFELLLPIPKNKQHREEIEMMVKNSIEDRIEARELARKAKTKILEAA